MTEAEDAEAMAQADTVAPHDATAASASLDDELLRAQVKARMFGTGQPVRIGRYDLTHRLGQGGMGIVYAALDRELERKVAIKLLLPGRAAGGERMMREARALARLTHPNVVTVHEVGTHAGRVFVAMEFVEGPTLRQWLAQEHTRAEQLDVFLQAARGLAAAHRAGLVHRDFKPDNAIVGKDGRVRVLDFGVAKSSELDELAPALPEDERERMLVAQSLTRTGQLVGTPAYMAPEQILGRPVDARADVFAFCVACFETFEGRRPFAGEDVVALHESMRAGAPRPTRVSAELGAAVQAGLAYDPDERPSSLEPLISAMEATQRPAASSKRPLVRTAAVVATAVLVGGVVSAASGWLFGLRGGETPEVPAPVVPPVPPVPAPPAPVMPAPVGAREIIDVLVNDVIGMAVLDSPMCTPRQEAPKDIAAACTAWSERIETENAVDDETRCDFVQFCAGTTPLACPEGSRAFGTVGCVALDECTQDDLPAACEQGELTCCIRAREDMLSKSFEQRKKGRSEKELREAGREMLAAACRHGDNLACMDAGAFATAEDALHLHALACARGHLQACRRVARVGETAPEPSALVHAVECATMISPSCPVAHRDSVLLGRMAECSSIVHEDPASSFTGFAEAALAGFAAPDDVAPAEVVQLRAASQRYRRELHDELRAIAKAAGVDKAIIGTADLERLRAEVEHRIEPQRRARFVQAVHQTLADERAGLVTPPHDLAALDPLERWVRVKADLGERLHRAVAAELGEARADSLHRMYEGWPDAKGGLVSHGACPGDR